MDFAKVVIEEGRCIYFWRSISSLSTLFAGVKIAETAGGPDAAPIIKEYKKHGIYVIHKAPVFPILTGKLSSDMRYVLQCTSVRHALSAQNRMKVDCLSIDGFEVNMGLVYISEP
jgi:hypothetical protein